MCDRKESVQVAITVIGIGGWPVKKREKDKIIISRRRGAKATKFKFRIIPKMYSLETVGGNIMSTSFLCKLNLHDRFKCYLRKIPSRLIRNSEFSLFYNQLVMDRAVQFLI